MKSGRATQATQLTAKVTSGRLSQADAPSMSLRNALRVPAAIFDSYAGGPVNAIQLAQALNMTPTSGPFRTLCGAAIAYGLTSGGYNAGQITVTSIAQRIFRTTEEGDDLTAKREAFFAPRVISEFLNKYNGHALPSAVIAQNVLASMGVPETKTAEVLSLIVEGAGDLGLIANIKDKKFIQVSANGVSSFSSAGVSLAANRFEDLQEQGPNDTGISGDAGAANNNKPPMVIPAASLKNDKVFVTHGKNMAFVEPIKKLLKYGKLEAIVSVERQTTSRAVPDKVMDDMRSCGAAIIHVDAETQLTDASGTQHTILNPNVLIEIGAAMALYGKRFILLVKSGVALPSNLQGLYQVRYEGTGLSADEAMNLLEAINALREERSVTV